MADLSDKPEMTRAGQSCGSFGRRMTPNLRALFRRMMAERRQFARGSLDHNYRTRAARKYLWLAIGQPADKWEDR